MAGGSARKEREDVVDDDGDEDEDNQDARRHNVEKDQCSSMSDYICETPMTYISGSLRNGY